jgi:hypothetical protein
MTIHQGRPAERDFGLETVEFLRERLQVDDEWAEPIERGFRWWAGPLAQSIWAEPLFDDGGVLMSRVHIQTDFLRGFRGQATEQEAGLLALMKHATLSGPVRRAGDPTRLALASCVWVNDANMRWVRQLAAWAATIQGAEAFLMAPHIAPVLKARVDETDHPDSGPRDDPDEMLDIIEELVRPMGQEPSAFAGEEMLSVLEEHQRPPCVLAHGTDEGLSAEFPFRGGTSLLELLADEENPRVGSGLLAHLTLPDGDNSPDGALEMNERELRSALSSAPRSHFLGSWAPVEGGLTFCSFVPNAVHRPGLLLNLALSLRSRARWVAEVVFGDDWKTSFPAAVAAKRQQQAKRRP